MSFNRKYLCKSLCEATQGMIEYIFDSEKEEKLIYYLFGFADACYVTVCEEWDIPTNIHICMYEKNGVIVNIDPLFALVSGYVDEEEIVTIELGQTIADMICEYIEAILHYQRERGSITGRKVKERIIYGDLMKLPNKEECIIPILEEVKKMWT